MLTGARILKSDTRQTRVAASTISGPLGMQGPSCDSNVARTAVAAPKWADQRVTVLRRSVRPELWALIVRCWACGRRRVEHLPG